MDPSPSPAVDTAARSLAHWSEEGRREMEAFYALARLDYELLAKALDWPAVLRAVAARDGEVRTRLTLLDVACGSGKFPDALQRHGAIGALGGELEVAYDLLDPSAFSLAEAAAVLRPPFVEAARHEVTLEDLDAGAGPYDVVWATHALYALEPAHLERAARRFVAAIAPGGLGVVAQGSREGHYIRFDEAFRAGFGDAERVPYLTVEEVTQALRDAGAACEVRRLSYDHVIDEADTAVLEGYLQRCAFDDAHDLAAMRAAPVLGEHLDACRDADAGVMRFHHEVDLVLLGLPEGA